MSYAFIVPKPSPSILYAQRTMEDSVKISSLCDMLDSFWAQQPGQEILYEWVQWLQSYVLSHVGFGDGIVIRQSDMMIGPVDVRAVGKIVSVESVVQCLISYN
jgi:E3 ubiquitin-protein ligase RNF14